MRDDDAYRKFQDLIFQEIHDKERRANLATTEEFVDFAASKGFTIDDLIRMVESGMSGRDLWNAVISK